MRLISSFSGAALLWLIFLSCSTLALASPKPAHRLEGRQALASITSSVASSTQLASIDAAIAGIEGAIRAGAAAGNRVSNHTTVSSSSNQTTVSSSVGGDASPVPMVNSPLLLPSLSGCTSGDTTGTVTFTSEFAHHTGFETIEEDQEFWNDTGTVWVIQVVSPGYWVQDLGLFDGNNSDPEDTNAISLGSSSSIIAITVPTHGCISKHLFSSHQHQQLAPLTHSACSRQSRDLRSVGWSNPLKQRQMLNPHTRSAFPANILALQIRFSTLQLRLQIVNTAPP